jgi:hypothetical protein
VGQASGLSRQAGGLPHADQDSSARRKIRNPSRTGALERFHQRVHNQGRPGSDNQFYAMVLLVRLALNQPLPFQAVYNSRNSAVRQPHLTAGFLQAYTARQHYNLHNATLRTGQPAL